MRVVMCHAKRWCACCVLLVTANLGAQDLYSRKLAGPRHLHAESVPARPSLRT